MINKGHAEAEPWVVGGVAILVGVVPIILAWWFDRDRVWDAVSAGAVIATGIVVFWYTWETQRLRRTAEDQATMAMTAIQLQSEAIRAASRPLLVVKLSHSELLINNIGSGPGLALTANFRDAFSGVRLQRVAFIPHDADGRAIVLPNEINGRSGPTPADRLLSWEFRPVLELQYKDLGGNAYTSVIEFQQKGWGRLLEYHEPGKPAAVLDDSFGYIEDK